MLAGALFPEDARLRRAGLASCPIGSVTAFVPGVEPPRLRR
jgi:hypothetical protein